MKSVKDYEGLGRQYMADAATGNGSGPPAATAAEGDAAERARLAKLSVSEYDQQRKGAAKRMGIRVGTLDKEVARLRGEATGADGGTGPIFGLSDPEPWPEAVDGAVLLDALVGHIKKYVALPAHAAEAAALWTIHAHALDAAGISPILAITSPVLGCGKSTLLSLLSALAPRSLTASNITAASLFRAVEKWQPTLFVDEADSFLKDNEELRGILNSGHNRAIAGVIRCTGDNNEPRRFTTWAAKAVALIGQLPATLASRSIHVEMRRLAAGEQVAQLRADRLGFLEPFRRQAWRWAQDHLEALLEMDPRLPSAIRGRVADNWRPLLAIADLAGGGWPERARRAAEALEIGSDGDAGPLVLLKDIRALFAEHETDRLSSEQIVEALTAMEDRSWAEWKGGKPISKNGLAKLLKGFGVEPRTIRLESGTPKGYHLDSFSDAFARYLPAETATTPQTNIDGPSSDSLNATAKNHVADRKSTKPNSDGPCGVVADRTPQTTGVQEEFEF